jgi:predicted ArsR family transcriptional regulator
MPRASNSSDPRAAFQRGRIAEALADGPLTARQLAARLHLSLSGVTLHLAAMRLAPRQVRIAGYAPNPDSQRPAPKYGLGSNADTKFKKSRSLKGRISADDRKARILQLLGERQMTAAELVNAMLLERARIYVIEMHASGAVHVAKWKQDGTGAYRSPMYAAGPGIDAARPNPQTPHEKCARYWAKLRADERRYDHHKQRNRMRKKPQTWLSALMQ